MNRSGSAPPKHPARQIDVPAAQALVDAQRIAIRHPNPRVVRALSSRVDQALQGNIDPTDLRDAVTLHTAILDVAGLVQTELDRLKMELIHHLGAAKAPPSEPQQLNRVVG